LIFICSGGREVADAERVSYLLYLFYLGQLLMAVATAVAMAVAVSKHSRIAP
jgi:hypothetical protein